MRLKLALMFSLGSAFLGIIALGQTGEVPVTTRLKINGVCTCDAPTDEFQWTLVRKAKAGDADGYVCLCQSKIGTSRLALTIEERKRAEDRWRIGALKGHHNGTVEKMKMDGYTEISVRKPDLTPPIPNTVSFWIRGKDPKGAVVFVNCVTVFKERTYLFMAIAESEEAAMHLANTHKSLKELTFIGSSQTTEK